MGRKTIPQSQRAQPISFSLKPRLIDEIDEYAHDLRFSRSKFLMEAVNHFMLQQRMGYLDESNNVHNMTKKRKVVVGLTAIQEAVRDGDFTISNDILQSLSRAIDLYKMSESNAKTEALEAELATEPQTRNITFVNLGSSMYLINDNGIKLGRIEKIGKNWRILDMGIAVSFKTLQSAKQEVLDFFMGA